MFSKSILKPVAWRYVDSCGTFFTEDEADILCTPGTVEWTPLYDLGYTDPLRLMNSLLDEVLLIIYDESESFLDDCYRKITSADCELIQCCADVGVFNLTVLMRDNGQMVSDSVEFVKVVEWFRKINI